MLQRLTVEWVNEGGHSNSKHINEQMFELNEPINVSSISSPNYCSFFSMSYVLNTIMFEEDHLERASLPLYQENDSLKKDHQGMRLGKDMTTLTSCVL